MQVTLMKRCYPFKKKLQNQVTDSHECHNFKTESIFFYQYINSDKKYLWFLLSILLHTAGLLTVSGLLQPIADPIKLDFGCGDLREQTNLQEIKTY